MRKTILIFSALMMLMACGGKTAKGGDNDSTAVADSAVSTSSTDLWTEEAVEVQIRKMYDRLNDMDKNGVINIVALEDEFCSSYYLNLRNAIHKAIKDATGDDRMFFGDEEGYRFLAGYVYSDGNRKSQGRPIDRRYGSGAGEIQGY